MPIVNDALAAVHLEAAGEPAAEADDKLDDDAAELSKSADRDASPANATELFNDAQAAPGAAETDEPATPAAE
jgi:hypothetical protein